MAQDYGPTRYARASSRGSLSRGGLGQNCLFQGFGQLLESQTGAHCRPRTPRWPEYVDSRRAFRNQIPFPMQTRPVPKFSSFIAPNTSSSAEAGPSKPKESSRDNSARDESSRKTEERQQDRQTDPRKRRSDSDRHSKRSSKHGTRDRDRERDRPRHEKSTPTIVDERARRPAQFTLHDSGQSFYEDPYGASGTLYLEVKYWPPNKSAFIYAEE